MHGPTPGRNAISCLTEIQELVAKTNKFYLITWRRSETSEYHVLAPVDFTPLGPFTIDRIYKNGSDTFIRVDQLECDMFFVHFIRKFGGLFESPEHIQDYELRLKWLRKRKPAYLATLAALRRKGLRAIAESELPKEVQEAMEERRGQRLQ